MEGNVMDIKHHNTATHIFAFWDGFDEDAKHQVAKIFSGSEHVKYLAIVQTNIMSNTVKSLEGMGFARPKIVEVFKDLKVVCIFLLSQNPSKHFSSTLCQFNNAK